MIKTSTLIGIAAFVAVGFASPAFAQHAGTAYDRGLYAYGMVPLDGSDGSLAPPVTGGGSFGYNENLRRDQW